MKKINVAFIITGLTMVINCQSIFGMEERLGEDEKLVEMCRNSMFDVVLYGKTPHEMEAFLEKLNKAAPEGMTFITKTEEDVVIFRSLKSYTQEELADLRKKIENEKLYKNSIWDESDSKSKSQSNKSIGSRLLK